MSQSNGAGRAASFVLTGALLLVSAWSVQAAEWTPELWVLGFVVFGAGLAGFALACSRFHPFAAAIVASWYGFFWIGLLLGVTLPQKLDWHERSIELLQRFGAFVNSAVIGGRSDDALMFTLLLAVLFWVLGVTSAWAVTRRRDAWAAILPAGGVTLINLVYYRGEVSMPRYLAVYLAIALLLLVRTHLGAREAGWRTDRVGYSSEIRFEFWRAGLLGALGLIALAWFVPGAAANPAVADAWQSATRPWESVRTTWRRMFAAVPGYTDTPGDYYGSTLSLGGGLKLSDRPIMDVSADAGPHYYWRARVFDYYEDGQWFSSDDARLDWQANDRGLRLPDYAARRSTSASFYMYVPATTLMYAVPQPYAFSRDVRLELSLNEANEADVSAARARQVIPQGARYTVHSFISVASETQLRDASETYPDAIRERYLQLPATISERTRALAHELADAEPTAFDKALAIQNYLRANIAYSLDIPGPPPGQEPVDWALFSERRGYCNYYASAMVVMLRAVGIPARMSVGFAQGAFDLDVGLYQVTERDAHAWPEVYFPGYGWIEFEPTASQPTIDRTASAQSADAFGEENAPAPALLDDPDRRDEFDREAEAVAAGRRALSPLGVWLLMLALVAAGVAALGWRLWVDGWSGDWERATPAAIAYARLMRAAGLVGLRLLPGWTPHERAEALSGALPAGRRDILQITHEYETETFGHSDRHAWQSKEAWRRLRLRVWRGVLGFWWRQVKRMGVSDQSSVISDR